MRIAPLHPDKMTPEVRFVHEEVVSLVTRIQGPVTMVNEQGALIGPFPPMLRFPQFGIPALSFVRSLDSNETLPKKVKEVAILTVGAAFNCRFELYAHEIMAAHFGFSAEAVAQLATGTQPPDLTQQERLAFQVAGTLCKGGGLPDSLYKYAIEELGEQAVAELIFLISAYAMLAVVLNGFDVKK